MKTIDLIEHGGGQCFIRHHGRVIALEDPAGLHYQHVLLALANQYAPGTPEDMAVWKVQAAFDRWRAAFDLPLFMGGQRLAYLVDHHAGALTYDLRALCGEDLGALWRARRWQTMLDLIDRLPSHSHYAAAVANDEEHANLVAKAMSERKDAGEDSGDAGPSLVGYTPEVALLTQVVDEVRRVNYTVAAVQIGKKAGEPPKPLPRPTTAIARALKRAEFNRRKTAHEALVARVLPNRST